MLSIRLDPHKFETLADDLARRLVPRSTRLSSALRQSPRTQARNRHRSRKDSKEARNRRIFDLWLACWTQQEIAEAVGAPQKTIDDVIASFSENGKPANLAKSDRAAAEHATDFDPPAGPTRARARDAHAKG